MKRLIVPLLAALLTILLTLFAVGSCKKARKLDAVIILPGIMGSELFLAEDSEYDGKIYPADTKLWLDVDSVQQIFAVPEHIKMLASGSDYNIRVSTPVINDSHVLRRYGALNTYSTLYQTVYSRFHDICDVVFYSYDWREDPYETARKFDSFITARNYDNISIVAHSMGGIVASHYFAMGEAQRSKVNTYLSLGTPYLGSEQAEYAMITGNISGFFANVLISEEARNICPKLDSMYALLPYEHLWRSSLGVYTLKGTTPAKAFRDEEILLADYVQGFNRNQYNKASEAKKLLFTQDGKHISELVNSYYLAGNGESTIVTVSLPENINFANTLSTATRQPTGDGTVSLYSATVGGTLPFDRTFIKMGGGDRLASHSALADGSDKSTMEFVIKVLQGEVDNLSNFDLKSKYNIEKYVPDFD